MNELVRHVEKLFADYPQTSEIHDLKEEVLTNLEAKAEDLMEKGMSYKEACEHAIQGIDTIEFMTEGASRTIDINQAGHELIQSGFIFALLTWIISIPSRVFVEGRLLNNGLTALCIILGFIYVLFLLNRRSDAMKPSNGITVDLPRIRKWRSRVWMWWGLTIGVVLATVTASRFGSHIWYGRPIELSGPYQYAHLLFQYAGPLLSIAIPLFLHRACTILQRSGGKQA